MKRFRVSLSMSLGWVRAPVEQWPFFLKFPVINNNHSWVAVIYLKANHSDFCLPGQRCFPQELRFPPQQKKLGLSWLQQFLLVLVTGSLVIFLTNFSEDATFWLHTLGWFLPSPIQSRVAKSFSTFFSASYLPQLLTRMPAAVTSLWDRIEIMRGLPLGPNTYISLGIGIKAKSLLLQRGWWEIISYP